MTGASRERRNPMRICEGYEFIGCEVVDLTTGLTIEPETIIHSNGLESFSAAHMVLEAIAYARDDGVAEAFLGEAESYIQNAAKVAGVTVSEL